MLSVLVGTARTAARIGVRYSPDSSHRGEPPGEVDILRQVTEYVGDTQYAFFGPVSRVEGAHGEVARRSRATWCATLRLPNYYQISVLTFHSARTSCAASLAVAATLKSSSAQGRTTAVRKKKMYLRCGAGARGHLKWTRENRCAWDNRICHVVACAGSCAC